MADLLLTDEYAFLGGVGGSCALCNASKRTLERPERIVTTSLVTDMQDAPPGVWPEKYMEFCEQCVNEMGHLVGMISEKEVYAYQMDIMTLEKMNAKLGKEVDELKEELEAMAKALAYIRAHEPALMPTSVPADPPVTRTKR